MGDESRALRIVRRYGALLLPGTVSAVGAAATFAWAAYKEFFPHFAVGAIAAYSEAFVAYLGEVRHADKELAKVSTAFAAAQSRLALADRVLSVGILEVTQRGYRDEGEWRPILQQARGPLQFYGKDHSRLLKNQFDILTTLIKQGRSIQFYLLDEDADYYRTAKDDERARRKTVGDQLRGLQQACGGLGSEAGQISVKTVKAAPLISYTNLGDVIYLGVYLPGMDNPDIPEFKIQKGSKEWLWHAAISAFEEAIKGAENL